ncbi:MAG: nickel-dependent lactate racemase [Actinobacteria bacterium]|nr:nickel-dependent lactate racemase [Actinomycetota bacterium]
MEIVSIKIPFGKGQIEARIPKRNFIESVEMDPIPLIDDPILAVTRSIENPIGSRPLSEIAKGKRNACIVVFDITRPVPNSIILPPILKTLHEAGMAVDDITLLIATGLHRPNLGDELICMVGEEICNKYNIINHDAKNAESHKFLGFTERGIPIEVDRTFLDADLKILTGSIEPHFMAGFTGGRKGICPGISSINTIRGAHVPEMLEPEAARSGNLEGNPLHEMATEISRKAGVDFICNAVLNKDRKVIGVFSGDLEEAYLKGVEFSKKVTEIKCKQQVDVVLTTNGGYPLDVTLYQAVKGMVGALPLVKKGGTVIIASECSEGIGSKEFYELLRTTSDLEAFVRKLYDNNYFVIDQWEVEELAKAKRKADIIVYSIGIKDEDFPSHLIEKTTDLNESILKTLAKYGESATISVIPDGPYVVPLI